MRKAEAVARIEMIAGLHMRPRKMRGVVHGGDKYSACHQPKGCELICELVPREEPSRGSA